MVGSLLLCFLLAARFGQIIMERANHLPTSVYVHHHQGGGAVWAKALFDSELLASTVANKVAGVCVADARLLVSLCYGKDNRPAPLIRFSKKSRPQLEAESMSYFHTPSALTAKKIKMLARRKDNGFTILDTSGPPGDAGCLYRSFAFSGVTSGIDEHGLRLIDALGMRRLQYEEYQQIRLVDPVVEKLFNKYQIHNLPSLQNGRSFSLF